MFCDLVDSGRLADRLDPEDWNDIVLDYYRTCESVVQRFDGNVAEERGDGLMVYFGWPVAHEDDAYRAVCTGLGVIRAINDLNARLTRERGIGLRVRIGIDTGNVVVGDNVDGQKGERAAGNTPNVAFRLQSIAKPDTVLMSGATFSLVRGYFNYEDLGLHDLKNVANAVHVYRVVADSGIANRLDAVGDRGLTPFIGRKLQFDTLLDLWDRVTSGQSQTVEIIGGPGIGKSRLVRAISERITHRIVFHCSPVNTNSALFPVTRGLERLLGFDQVEEPERKLRRLEDSLDALGFPAGDVAGLLASEFSLPLPDRYQAPNLSAQQKRQQTLDVLVQWLLKEAEQQPLLAIWEDLHWADPSTIELLGLVIERARTTPLLTLLTFRPEFQPGWTPAGPLMKLPLHPLERRDVEEMIAQITSGRSLPDEVVNHIVEKTDGVPLFVEELLQTVLDSGFVRSEGDHYVIARQSSPVAIPATLEGSLMSRLDRLGAAKAIAQRAAVLGRAFSQDLIRAVLETDTESEEARAAIWLDAQRCLTQLIEAGILRRRRARQTTFEFKHALIQDAAYESLLKRSRQAYHLKTARVLETQFADVVETQPELVAHHYGRAFNEKAPEYWQKAGERARDRSANKEAVHHFFQALTALETLPESEPRDRRELMLLVASLTPLIAVKGYVAEETAQAVHRALVLGQKLGETLGQAEGLFSVLYVQWVTRLVRGNYAEALQLSEDFLREAESQQDAVPRLMGHRLRGFSLFSAGEGDLVDARDHLQRSLTFYDPKCHSELKNQGYGQDPRCASEAFLEAAEWSRTSIDHAKAANHSNTWGYVLCWGGATYDVFCRDIVGAGRRASDLILFAEKEGLPVWLSYGTVLHGWALSQSGEAEEGVRLMKKGLADFDYPTREQARSMLGRPPQGMGFMKSFLLSLLAEAHGKRGQAEEGIAVLDTAWSIVEANREGFWKAEVMRLRGELILQAGGSRDDRADTAAETSFMKAREIASAQGARSLELRAATSLGRLWLRKRPSDARRMLEEVYSGFTEGFESFDLVEARGLLDDLTVAR
jgi:class 3 adenylate cyclase